MYTFMYRIPHKSIKTRFVENRLDNINVFFIACNNLLCNFTALKNQKECNYVILVLRGSILRQKITNGINCNKA
jgi:hypothetical protein